MLTINKNMTLYVATSIGCQWKRHVVETCVQGRIQREAEGASAPLFFDDQQKVLISTNQWGLRPMVTPSAAPILKSWIRPCVYIFGLKSAFLAHLSTKCSGWAIVIGLCPSSVVVRRPSCVVRRASSVNFF